MRFRRVLVAAISAGLLIVPSSASAATTVHVNIVNFAFQNASDSSSTTNIAEGDSVEWDWAAADGITPHSTTSDASSTQTWDSAQHTQPHTYTQLFSNAGVFTYHCTVHASMHGKIVVGDVFQFSASTASVIEGGTVDVTVQRLGAASDTAMLPYSTSGGTATAGIDYVGQAGTLSWAAGETSKMIPIVTKDDAGSDTASKDFMFNISSPTSSNGAALGTPASVTVTILEPQYQPDAMVRGPADSTYRGGNKYNTLTGQTSLAKVPKGKSATFQVRVQNDGNVPDSFGIKGKGSTTSFSIRYFHGTTDITKSVAGGTASTTVLAPGKIWTMKAVITPKRAASIGSLLRDVVTTHSMTDTSKKDAVQLEEKVVSS
jgi:plastocyanin